MDSGDDKDFGGILEQLFEGCPPPEIPKRPQATEYDVNALLDVPDLGRILLERAYDRDIIYSPHADEEELGKILDSPEYARKWIGEHAPGYRNDRLYVSICESFPNESEAGLLSRYARDKWINLNYIHHRRFLREEAWILREEVALSSRIMGELPD